jgi:hypothetical protein
MSFESRVYACKGSLHEILDYVALEISRRKHTQNNIDTFGRPENFPEIALLDMKEHVERIEEWRAIQKKLITMFPDNTINAASVDFYDSINWPHFHERWTLQSSYPHGTPPPGYSKGIIMPDSPEELERFSLLLCDPNTLPEIRTCVINILEQDKSVSSLYALIEVLNDTTIYDTTPWWLYDDFPLIDHPLMKEWVPEIKKFYDSEEKPKPKTFGQLAQEALERATGQKFGDDKTVWKDWIEKNY